MDTKEQIEFFTKEIVNEISETRFEHSLQVARIAKKIAISQKYPDPDKAFLAGIVHDITKQKKNDFHIQLFNSNKIIYSSLPPRAYHAISGSLYLVSRYQFRDLEILSAVRNHTLGGRNLSLLDKILYVSDYLGSDYASRLPNIDQLIEKTQTNLFEGLILKSKAVISELISKNDIIHPLTIETYNEACENLKMGTENGNITVT